MKRLKHISMLIIALMVCMIAPVVAQTLPNGDPLPPMDQWFGSMESVYSAVVVIGGYLSKWIPGLNQINVGKYRVLAFAILVGAGFWYFGADIWGLAVSYFLSTSMYELVLKEIKGSPPTDAQATTKRR